MINSRNLCEQHFVLALKVLSLKVVMSASQAASSILPKGFYSGWELSRTVSFIVDARDVRRIGRHCWIFLVSVAEWLPSATVPSQERCNSPFIASLVGAEFIKAPHA